jgi:hypothetical protein
MSAGNRRQERQKIDVAAEILLQNVKAHTMCLVDKQGNPSNIRQMLLRTTPANKSPLLRTCCQSQCQDAPSLALLN